MRAATNSNLTSATIEASDEQNIIFIGSDSRFHVLDHYQNVWNDYDIFELIGKNVDAKGMPAPPKTGDIGPARRDVAGRLQLRHREWNRLWRSGLYRREQRDRGADIERRGLELRQPDRDHQGTEPAIL
jgi:hypothetical protein